jgi:MraZ protein
MLKSRREWGTFPLAVEPGWWRSSHSTTSVHSIFDRTLETLAFRGAFDYTLDAKNRLTVPAKFRAALSEGMVLAKSVDPCVAVWRAEDYERFIAETLQDVNPLSPKRRQLERYLSANSFDAELDGAGRVGIPTKLAEHAGLGKEVVVTGVGRFFEVWDRERWLAYDTTLTAEIPDIAASLGHPA